MNNFKMLLHVLFAWFLLIVIHQAGECAITVCFNPSPLFPFDPPEIAFAFLVSLQYAAAGFFLGTMEKRRHTLMLALLLITMEMIFPMTATTIVDNETTVWPSIIGIVAVMWSIDAGQSTNFCWRNSALNIPNHHWLWLIPTSLFQAVCVPLTLFLGQFAIRSNSITPDAAIVLRICLAIALPLYLLMILNAYKILSSRKKLTNSNTFGLACTWFVLTLTQVFLCFVHVGKDYM